MKQQSAFPLTKHNTFAIKSVAKQFYQPETVAELIDIPSDIAKSAYILGDGSNTLFMDDEAPVIIHPCIKGISVEKNEASYTLTVATGENWHDLVSYCVERNMCGLENLALIPGSVGAAPVQNIGAYGVEFSDVCTAVQWYEFESSTLHTLTNEACNFSYRDSVFKQALRNKGVITSVTLTLSKTWQANIQYKGLDVLASLGGALTAKDVMTKVIEIREGKLPDPEQLPNAGSFFKNPIVDENQFKQLINRYPEMPYYPQTTGRYKLAAGWLIEATGLKGYQMGDVAVHAKQALVLVNTGEGTGQHVVQLAQYAQKKVHEKFQVTLIPEVRFVSQSGELNDERLQCLFL